MEGKGVSFEERMRVEAEEEEANYFDDEYEEEEEEEENESEEDDGCVTHRFMPSPLVPLKDHLEKDKEDASLRRWKEKLLGDVGEELIDRLEPEVIFHSIGFISDGYEDIIIPLPIQESDNKVLFTLKEGAKYHLKLKFSVQHNIVSGLSYMNTVWKGSRKVEKHKGMLGTYAPSRNPYEEMLKEETTPSGMFARGVCHAKLQFKDDDDHCFMDLNYSFEITKR